MGFIKVCLLFLLGLLSLSCGYTLQNSHSRLADKEGIRKVYVYPIVNNSYKPGAESVVYNNLIRSLSSHGRVNLVHRPHEADAFLLGKITNAAYAKSAGTSVANLNPVGLGKGLPSSNYEIATEYTASLGCSFQLIRKDPPRGKRSLIWAASFGRSKPFPALNQLDVLGTTSALINESEFDRALKELSRNMMEDVNESMLAMF